MLLVHAGDELLQLPHALDVTGVGGDGAPSTIFFLKPWSKPDVDLPPQGVLAQTAVDGGSSRHGEHIPKA